MSKQKGSKVPEGMVVGGRDRLRVAKIIQALPMPRVQGRRRVVAAVLVVLLVVGVCAWLAMRDHHRVIQTNLSAKDISRIPTEDYEGMTEQELNYRVQDATGHTIAELSTMNINGRTLKSYEAAYAASQALQRLGKTDKAFQAYAVADTKAPKDAYRFHLKYAYYAYDNSKNNIAVAQAKKSKASIAAADISDTQRKSVTNEANAFLTTPGGTQ
jgi:hypothetical protein